jgi:hypothetical protein
MNQAKNSRPAVSAGTWAEFPVTGAISGNGVYSFGTQNNSIDQAIYYSRQRPNFPPQLVIQP